MSFWNRAFDRQSARGLRVSGSSLAAAILLAAASLPALVFALLVPAALVLPALGTVSIVVAGALGLYAWWSGAALEGDSFTAWDLSGAFVMVACAAGILSEPEHVARFVTGLTAISK